MNIKSLLSTLALLGLATACGKTATSTTWSCTLTTPSSCLDFGVGYTEDTSRTTCTALSGTFSNAGSCSAVTRVGRCTTIPGVGFSYVTSYYSPTFTAEQAQALCASPSTWAPLSVDDGAAAELQDQEIQN